MENQETEAPPINPEADDPAHAGVLRRIRLFSGIAYVFLAFLMIFLYDARALLGLTCGALVVMINFLWLEEIVKRLLQPSPTTRPGRLLLRTFTRFVLFGVALSVAIFVARLNEISVLLGFSILVIGIMGEAVYSAIRGV